MVKGKKVTGRTHAIYPRVSEKSYTWLNKAAKYTNKSQAEIIDTLLVRFAKNWTNKEDIQTGLGVVNTRAAKA